MGKVIPKSELPGLFRKLSDYEIWAPVMEDGVTLFRRVEKDPPELEFQKPQKPPKEIFFPQTQKMFDFELEGRKVVGLSEPESSSRPLLLFGVRPCDARAFLSLDRLFNWDYSDPYYQEKRDRSTVVSLTCKDPQESCFCTSVGGSPHGIEGADMLWTEIGDHFFVESFTERGRRIEELGGGLFKAATKVEEQSAKKAKEESEKALSRKVDLTGVKEALEGSFDDPYWEETAQRCLGCGICTFLCPTCHCFDINDITCRGTIWRERTWDSCQFSHYTVHASGHNPRPARLHRQRNRILHKFLNMERRLEVPGCVGCGRCIEHCPVKIDILEVVEDLKNKAK